MISRSRAGFLFSDQSSRPNQQQITAHQPTLNPATLSLADRSGPRVGQQLILILASLASDPHRTRRATPRPWVRGMGRPSRPAGPHAEGPVRAHTRGESGPGRELPLLPPRRAPLHLGLRKGERSHLGRPDGQSRGSLGLSPRRSQRQGSKATGGGGG
jgi:hypothetical protein